MSAFNDATAKSWGASIAEQDALFTSPSDSTVRQLAWADTSATAVPLRDYERATGSRVYAWALQPIPEPPLVAQIVADESLLHTAEQLSNAQVASEPELLWQLWHQLGERQPVDWTAFPAHFIAARDPSRNIGVSIVAGTAGWWIVYLVTPHQDDAQPDDTAMPAALLPVDPGSPQWQQTAKTVSDQRGINVYALGPLALDAVPIRIPDKTSAATAADLGRAIWPNDRRLYSASASSGPIALSSREASFAKGSSALVRTVGVFGRGAARSDTLVGQSIMYASIASTDSAEGALGGWQSLVVGAAPDLPFALAVAVVLFALSVVASVVSFAAQALQPAAPPESQ